MRKQDFRICENKDEISSLALFSNCAAQFVSDLVENPEDWVSHVAAPLGWEICDN